MNVALVMSQGNRKTNYHLPGVNKIMPIKHKQNRVFLPNELSLILATALLAAIVLLAFTPAGDALGATISVATAGKSTPATAEIED
jgi:hypothetical protein